MKRHVLILGAGFGGLELATRLSETASDAVDVTLLDRNDSFFFGFSKLEVMLGRQSADDVRLPYRDIAKDGVEFRQETVVGIDPVARRVETDAGTHDADFLVVAMGADYDIAATPGFEEGGYEYYSLAGARAAARRARRLRGRTRARVGARAAVQVSAGAVRGVVPPARALHATGHSRRRADGDDLPDAAPRPGDRRGLADVPRRARRARDRGAPPAPRHQHRPGRPHRRSWPTARRSPTTCSSASRYTARPSRSRPRAWRSTAGCRSTRPTSGPHSPASTPSATSAPARGPSPRPGSSPRRPRASSPTTSGATISGDDPPAPYEGSGVCYAEFGDGLVSKVEVNFLRGESPAAERHDPSREYAAEKARVRRYAPCAMVRILTVAPRDVAGMPRIADDRSHDRRGAKSCRRCDSRAGAGRPAKAVVPSPAGRRSDLGDSGSHGLLGAAKIRTLAFRRDRARVTSTGPGGDLSASGVGSNACFHAIALAGSIARGIGACLVVLC